MDETEYPEEILQFFSEFKKEVDSLLDEDCISGDKQENDDDLSAGCFTFLFNISCYNIAKRRGYKITVENAVGRGAYSDILLKDKDGHFLIEIEHEDRPDGKKKGLTYLDKSLRNLGNSKSKYKVLITYTWKNFSENKLLELCKKNLVASKTDNIFVFYANYEFDSAEEFKIQRLK